MRFQCLFCNFIIHIDDSKTGRKNKCPSCGSGTPILSRDTYILGRILGDFVIKHKIGEEASAEVFLAHQISLDRLVALKVFPKTFSKADTFLNEARISASLNHPNLISVLAVGEEEGICFIAMNYIKGISLQHYLKTKRSLPVDEALHIIQQAAEALHFAWTEKQVIHKEIKPDSIMLCKNGVVKVTGLGFAMATGEREWYSDMDIHSAPEYMSPESFLGRKNDTRSEIYSLGIVLYQMQTGELPFDGCSFESIVHQRLYKTPEKIPCKKLKIPEEVGALISKMLEKNPEKRHQSMEYLIKEIIVVRKLTAQRENFMPSLHSVSFKKTGSGIRRELLHPESEKANLNFAFKTAKFIGRSIFLMRKSRRIMVNSKTPKRLGARLCLHDHKPPRQILLNSTTNWTKTVEKIRRFEKELNLSLMHESSAVQNDQLLRFRSMPLSFWFPAFSFEKKGELESYG